MSGENILNESTSFESKEVKLNHVGKDRKDDLHMDENDEESSPRESVSPNVAVVDDEETAHQNEKEEPKGKISKRSKVSHSSTEDIKPTSK